MAHKQPSLRKLAQDLGVSPSLISMVLNDRWQEANIAPATQQRVLRELERLNYRPNRLAIALRQKRTDTIGVMLPVLATFYEEILRGIDGAMGERFTINLGICDYNPQRERQILVSFLEKRVDGLIIVPSGLENLADLLAEVRDKRIPLMLVDRRVPGMTLPFVGSDHVAVGRLAAEHLLEQGYPDILFLAATPLQLNTMIRDRVQGFSSVAGRDADHVSILYEDLHGRNRDFAAVARDVADLVLKDRPLPLGVYVNGSRLAEFLFLEFERRGVRCPQDVGILTADQPENTDRLFRVPLSSIRQQTGRIGQCAGERLIHMIADPETLTYDQCLQMPVQVVGNASTRLSSGGLSSQDHRRSRSPSSSPKQEELP